MFNKHIVTILVAVVLSFSVLAVVSCSTVAISGRQRLNLVADDTINTLADQEYAKFMNENELSSDAQASAMVKRIGYRLKSAVERYSRENGLSSEIAGYQWEFNLVEGDQVNAWAMPGGKVVVYTGMLDVAEDEDGLAVVVAHEIAHVFAKHGAERLTQAMLIDLGGMALSEAIAKEPARTQDIFKRSYSMGTQLGFALPYSRVHEYEADHLGLMFMAMAGYDPEAAVDFWQRMSEQKDGSVPDFLSTHPSDDKRIEAIKERLPEAMQYYDRAD